MKELLYIYNVRLFVGTLLYGYSRVSPDITHV